MVVCASCGCVKTPNVKQQGILFHKFPKNEKRRQEWMAFANKKNSRTKHSYLCSQHFTADCFERTTMNTIRLRDRAMPTVRISGLKYLHNSSEFWLPPEERIEKILDPSPLSSTLASAYCVAVLAPEDDPSTAPNAINGENVLAENSTDFPHNSVNIKSEISDSPDILELDRKLRDVSMLNVHKLKKIRQLEKIVSKQKKKIEELSSLMNVLKAQKYSIK